VKQYLIFSGTFHVAAAAALLLVFRPALNRAAQQTIYAVDFVGAPAQEAAPVRPAQPAPPAAQQTAQKSAPASREITDRPYKLSPPSVLAKYRLPQPKAEPAAAPAPAPARQDADAQQDSSGGVSADFPNFPYPWYITQVRAALWNEWSLRMPNAGAIGAVAQFRISRAGRVEGLSIEKSSGNKLFDFAALASVEQAAPFPPLPADYRQDTLTAHVEFRTMQ